MAKHLGKLPAKILQLPVDKILIDSDLDGIFCGAMLLVAYPGSRLIVGEARKVAMGEFNKYIGPNTVVADLPYVLPSALHIDHHTSTKPANSNFAGRWAPEPSAARVTYEIFKDKVDLSNFEEVLQQVDKFDSGDLTSKEVEDPRDFVLLGMATDRSNTKFIKHCIQVLAGYPMAQLWGDSLVKETCDNYFHLREEFRAFAASNIKVIGDIAFLDHSEFKGRFKISGFEIGVMAKKANTLVKINRKQMGETKVAMYRNSQLANPSELDLLELALMVESNAGGHKYACGFNTALSPTEVVDKIVQCARNMRK